MVKAMTDQPQTTDGCDDPDCEYPHCLCGVPPSQTTVPDDDLWLASISYDQNADVLYITLGKTREADEAYEVNRIVHRFKDGQLIGLTIIDAKERLRA
jgi:uncharacterized protein YuzE